MQVRTTIGKLSTGGGELQLIDGAVDLHAGYPNAHGYL